MVIFRRVSWPIPYSGYTAPVHALPDSTRELAQANQRRMRVKFYDLVANVSVTLSQKLSMELDERNGVRKFKCFREYVAGLCGMQSDSIRHKKTVGEIFGVIQESKCWDLNGNPYNLLLSIVEGVGDLELTRTVEEKHLEYYAEYLVATKVADHICVCNASELSDPEKYQPNYTRLSIKLGGVKVNECSLAYLIDLWKAVKKYVLLPDLFSVLASIEEGSLVVTWLVPPHAVPAFMKLPYSFPEFLRKFSITAMMVNGVCFFEVSSQLQIGIESYSYMYYWPY